jgi:hypothetical protein
MARGLQLPYAMRAGQVVGISDVESGLRLDCVCPVCGHALVAKKGQKVTHHFAHHRDSECAHATETLLHFAAKQVIEEERRLVLPPVRVLFEGGKPAWEVAPARMTAVDLVRIESRLGSDVPDLILSLRDRCLAIEITVTHRTGDEKVRRLSKQGCSVLEIDLSQQSRFLTLDELKALVVHGAEYKRWLFNRLADDIQKDVHTLCERKPTIYRGFALHVDDCPIPARVWRGKPYANVIDDCWSCEYCVTSGSSDGESRPPMLCLGRSCIRTYDEWRALRTTQKRS